MEVLSWVEEAKDDVNSIATELEYILISELFKRCANEIRHLRSEVERLEKARKRSSKKMVVAVDRPSQSRKG